MNQTQIKNLQQANTRINQQKMVSNTISTVFLIIEQLLGGCFQNIKQKKLLSFTPNYLQSEFMSILKQQVNQGVPNITRNSSKLKEENVSTIKKIDKDNLTPKQLPNEIDQMIKELPQPNLSQNSRRISLLKRSSLIVKKQSEITQVFQASITERTNQSIKSMGISRQKTIKQSAKKKNPLQNFTCVLVAEKEDPEIVHLRQKAYFNQKERQKQQAIHNQRTREDQQKVSNFNAQFTDNSNYTFDFDGIAISSNLQDDEKINYYAMKVGFKSLNKKYRTIYKHLQNSNDSLNQNQDTIIKIRSSRMKDSPSNTLNIDKSVADIPVFQNSPKIFVPQTDPLKLRIIDDKRLYGKKFSRYDKESLTIEMSTLMDKKMNEEDFFSSRKHLTDSLNVSKSRCFSVNKEYTAKKLALPKIHGKYKVLDRYDSIEIN